MKFSPLKIALLTAFVPSYAFAQVTTLDTVVVTASRQAEPLKNVLGNVVVVDNAQLQKESDSTLLSALARQPGIQLYHSGGAQTTAGVFVNGAAPSQTLVMFNGMRLNDANTGGVYWNTIDPALLDRVEIIRGAASGLYGSMAMGGVINLITTPATDGPRDTLIKTNIGVGSNGLFRTNAGVSGATEKWDYHLAGSYATTDGYNATHKKAGFVHHPDSDGYDQAGLLGSVGYTFVPGHRLGVNFMSSVNRGDFDGGSAYANTFGYTRQKVYGFNSTNQITDRWQSILQVSASKVSYEARSQYPSKFSTSAKQYSWQNNFALTEHQTLSLVYEHTAESILNRSGSQRSHRLNNAFAVLYQGDFDRHHLQANLRRDNISGLASSNTGSLAYAFDMTPSLQAGVGFSTGFRAPTFADMYSPLNWGYQGNPNLKPEKSRHTEFNLRYQDGDTQAKLTVFQTKYIDLINGYVCNAFFQCTAQNINKAKVRGLSLEASHRFGNTTISAGADFLNPKDETNGKRLIRRAKEVYRLGVQHELDRWSLGADYLFVGNRYDNAQNTSARRLGGYGLLNLRANFQVNKQLALQASINNVFNKHYETAYGYRSQGSNVFLNLSYQH